MNEHDDYELPARVRQRIRKKIKTWYHAAARALPWRETHDPYRIWISEIMLQQTTVAAVVPYYERFFTAFPTLETLAQAEEQDVLKLWEGLGYYSRARNIWKTARLLWEESQGTFPETVAELSELPGIGRYTAGAIASFAFDRKAPILEANTLRLYARLIGYAGDPRTAAGQRTLWQFAEQILSPTSPGLLNQALMELGSRICTPADPRCSECPVHRECRAFAAGKQAEIPHRAKRTPPTEMTEVSIAIKRGNTYLLRQRSEGERWAGLWDFPRYELTKNEVVISPQSAKKPSRLLAPGLSRTATARVLEAVQQQTGIQAELDELTTEIRHTVTRYRIHLLCYKGSYLAGIPLDNQRMRWIDRKSFVDYPLSTTGRQFADLLAGKN